MISYLRRKEWRFAAFVRELCQVYRQIALDESVIKYWIHDIKIRRSKLKDYQILERSSLDQLDREILTLLPEVSLFSI